MTLLPVAEAVLRRTLRVGIAGVNGIVQHLVLVVAMIGGAVSAREGRLLSLSTIGESFLKGRLRDTARLFAGSVGAVVSLLLGLASLQFAWTEREAGKRLVIGIPVWAVELILPLGFGLIAARLWWRSADGRARRAAAATLAAALLLAAFTLPAGMLLPVALAALAAATLLGTPAFVTLGGAALVLFWAAGQPIAAIPISQYSLVTNPSVPAIPLFTLAGCLLAKGGAPRRLVRVFDALFGGLRGGAAIVTVLVCAFFTTFTGASGVTILALGPLLMPVLQEARYAPRDALGLLTGSGSLGLLFPPCLPLILYAIVAQVPIETMFLGGIVPGLVLVAGTLAWGTTRSGSAGSRDSDFELSRALRAVADAKWELLLPAVAVGALFSGIATPVEAAALTALYAGLVETCVYRDVRIGCPLLRILAESAVLVGGILLILGVSLGFTNYLVDAEIPSRAVEWTTGAVHSRVLFLLLLNLFLLVVGCLMDIYSAIVVQVPLLVPLGAAYGIDPVHLGIVFLANLELGYLTPPVGLNLFMASSRFEKPLPEVLRAVLPVIAVLAAGVLLITYLPALSTTLPAWLGK